MQIDASLFMNIGIFFTPPQKSICSRQREKYSNQKVSSFMFEKDPKAMHIITLSTCNAEMNSENFCYSHICTIISRALHLQLNVDWLTVIFLPLKITNNRISRTFSLVSVCWIFFPPSSPRFIFIKFYYTNDFSTWIEDIFLIESCPRFMLFIFDFN